MYKLLICGAAPRKKLGTPGWTDKEAIRRELSQYDPDDTVVIHGDAEGADRLAGEVAEELGMRVIPVPALWATQGRPAGPIRNRKMLAMGPDEVLAFHENIEASSGTKDMVRIAEDAGIPTTIFAE